MRERSTHTEKHNAHHYFVVLLLLWLCSYEYYIIRSTSTAALKSHTNKQNQNTRTAREMSTHKICTSRNRAMFIWKKKCLYMFSWTFLIPFFRTICCFVICWAETYLREHMYTTYDDMRMYSSTIEMPRFGFICFDFSIQFSSRTKFP